MTPSTLQLLFARGLIFIILLVPAGALATSRIVGGQPASTKEWPFIVALVEASTKNAHRGLLCGGSLITKRVVLTAAHCVQFSPPSDFNIVNRRFNLQGRGGWRVSVSEIKIHPRYSDETIKNDLALLKLKKPLRGPYPWLSKEVPEEGALEVAGWGWDGARYPAKLHSATTARLGDAACQGQYASMDPGTMFCTNADGRDSCVKDSGGPIVQREANKTTLYGVVSWGGACKTSPGVYARLDISWIRQIIKNWQ